MNHRVSNTVCWVLNCLCRCHQVHYEVFPVNNSLPHWKLLILINSDWLPFYHFSEYCLRDPQDLTLTWNTLDRITSTDVKNSICHVCTDYKCIFTYFFAVPNLLSCKTSDTQWALDIIACCGLDQNNDESLTKVM